MNTPKVNDEFIEFEALGGAKHGRAEAMNMQENTDEYVIL